MSRKVQSTVLNRRKPTQARARATIESIFEATARIIDREGIAALNTNRIAERAGISIGTLYEYYPNKDAILIAMARRRLAEDESSVRQAISGLDDDGSLVRNAIRAMIALHVHRPKVRRAIMAVHLANGLGSEHVKPVQEIAQVIAERNAQLPLSGASLFVVTRAVVGVVRAAFEERSQLPGTDQLEEELVRLVQAYLSTLPRANTVDVPPSSPSALTG